MGDLEHISSILRRLFERLEEDWTMGRKIPVSLENVPDFEALPGGEYVCLVADVEEIKAKTGAVGDRWIFEVRSLNEFWGRHLKDTTWRSEKALWRLKRLCQAVGYEPDGNGVDADRIVGQVLKVKVQRVEEGGREFNEVVSFRKATPEEIEEAKAEVPF